MTAIALRMSYSFAEYVRFERDAHEKHEFVGGLILAMAGGTLEHSRLVMAVAGSLMAQLRGRPCVVLESNARVRVAATGNAYYPDASVVCGTLERDADDSLSLANPTVLVEVLSPSTADYDRTDKLADYQLIPGLRHVVHVGHDEHRVDVWTHAESGWERVSYVNGETAVLNAVDCRLDVDEIYRDPLAPR
jgi:Uma2 family endonuclease